MPDALIIYGAGGHAAVVADAVRAGDAFTVAGFLDDDPARTGEIYYGATILGTRLDFPNLGEARYILGFGARPLAPLDGGIAVTVVHPRATVSPTAVLEPGVYVGPGAAVNARARIGAHAIVNSGAIVEHDCIVGEASHIGPGVQLAGRVRVGAVAWLGIGASVQGGVHIGDGVVIGAGAVVVDDIIPRVVAYGVPAKIIRLRRGDE